MSMRIPDIIDLIEMNLKEKWDLFTTLQTEYPELEKEYQKIRFGINQKFDIQYFFTKNFRLDQKNEEMRIPKMAKAIQLSDFYTEMEERKKLISASILKLEEGLTLEGRQ